MHNWCCFTLESDFFEFLRSCGRLPPDTLGQTSAVLQQNTQQCKEIDELRRKVEVMQKEITELKDAAKEPVYAYGFKPEEPKEEVKEEEVENLLEDETTGKKKKKKRKNKGPKKEEEPDEIVIIESNDYINDRM